MERLLVFNFERVWWWMKVYGFNFTGSWAVSPLICRIVFLDILIQQHLFACVFQPNKEIGGESRWSIVMRIWLNGDYYPLNNNRYLQLSWIPGWPCGQKKEYNRFRNNMQFCAFSWSFFEQCSSIIISDNRCLLSLFLLLVCCCWFSLCCSWYWYYTKCFDAWISWKTITL